MRAILFAIWALVVTGCSEGPKEKSQNKANNTEVQQEQKTTAKPDEGMNQEGLYANIKTTKGTIVIKLEFERVPMTVANFVGLAEGIVPNAARESGKPFYNGIIFHRIIKGFMIQGGDPAGTGAGGPGYRFPDEIDQSLKHDRPGTMSMANAGPNTNGSQFFITHAPTPHLDGRHAVFGYVVKGMEVVNSIAETPTGSRDRPVTDIVIENITIQRNGAKAEAFRDGSHEAFTKIKNIAAKSIEQEQAMKDEQKKKNEKMIKEIKKKYPKAVTTKSGLMYVVKKKGSGSSPTQGTKITAHYTGKLMNGKVFDSSVKRNQPFQFNVGVGRVIRGWDEAFLEMKKGEKRTLIIPPDLAYGSRGAGGVIPPNAWLIFDVELIDF